MEPARLLQLAATINSATSTIHEYLRSHNIECPSFEPYGPVDLPAELGTAQDSALDAISELHDLLVGPSEPFKPGSLVNPSSLDVISSFDIANLFAPGEEATFAQIAQSTGLSKTALKHVLRHAVTLRVFREPRKEVLVHTARSVVMRMQEARDYMNIGRDKMRPGFLRMADAFRKWPRSEEPNQTGFSLALCTDRTMYEDLARDAGRAAQMANAMRFFPAEDMSHVADAYDWSGLDDETVVDLGGSRGQMAAALALKHPRLNLVVQDLERTIEGAHAELPAPVSGRVRFMAHDFFHDQPVVAGVYFLRQIFHNWSDTYCVKILRALIPTLRPGARVIVNDICMPEPGSIPLWKERFLRSMDLAMISLFNSYERDTDDWHDLFIQADPRFRLVSIHEVKDSYRCLIEVVWMGESIAETAV